jgi:ABC-type sulfate transport system permease subunit
MCLSSVLVYACCQGTLKLTAVSVPVEIVLGVAGAFVLEAVVFTSRAVGEGNVVIGDVVEEMQLVLAKHQASGNRVDRRITPALVEETTCVV